MTADQHAENEILDCAAQLAERITSADGHAEATEKIVPYFLARNDVDAAAALADAIENTFIRDRLLIAVADKCAVIGDDEYAWQLIEAIEEPGFQDAAKQRVAARYAEKTQFEKALEIASTIDYNSHSLAAIALKLQESGDQVRALETLARIETAAIKAECQQDIALDFYRKGQTEKAENILSEACIETKNVEIAEERIRSLQSIAHIYGELGRKDKSIEILAEAQNLAEAIDGNHQNSLLSQISIAFLQAGSLDLADRALDLVNDKTTVAATLIAYASDYHQKGERVEALEILEEARAVLRSQSDREVRSSQEKNRVWGTLAVQFAAFENFERAVEVALENVSEEERCAALAQIARICASKNDEQTAQQAIAHIPDEAKKIEALIHVSDAAGENGNQEVVLERLREARAHLENIEQPTLKITLLNEIAVRLHRSGEADEARQAVRENLGTIAKIRDASLQAAALADLGAVYEKLSFQLNDEEKAALRALLG